MQLRLSLRVKTVLGIALIEAALLSVLVFSVMHFLRDSNEEQIQRHARVTVMTFASMSREGVISQDLGSLQSHADHLNETDGIAYARILDAKQRILAEAGKPEVLKRAFAADRAVHDIHDGIFDIASPINMGGVNYGSVQIGLDISHLRQTYDAAQRWSLGIAALEMLLVALFSFLLGRYLVRQIATFTHGAERISAGQMGWQLEVVGNDEIAQATRAFNTMSRAILTARETLEARVQERTDALARERDTAQRYLDIVGVMLLILDQNGRVMQINRKGLDIIGHEEAQLLGQNWFAMCFPAGDQSYARRHFGDFIAGSAVLCGRHENRIVNAAGQDVMMAWDMVLLHDASGSISGVLLSGEDISERKQAQKVLEELNASLLVEKNRAQAATQVKSEFLATMSHEIRTPMNGVLGMLQLLQRTPLNLQQRDYVDKTHAAAHSLLGILNDILDFSKVESGHLSLEQAPFSLDKVLHNISLILTMNVGAKPVEVLFDLDPALPTILIGDELRLNQVLINLAGNALKFTERGSVIVAVRVERCGENQVTLDFSVRDTGIGIAADKRLSIFESFTQAESSTSRRFGGTGLGLAISQRLVHLMGGALRVDSTIGVGSTFSFMLTFALADGGAADHSEQRRTRLSPQRSLRALIINDSAEARTVLQSMFAGMGCLADTAASGAEALERIQSSAAAHPYDVVCLNLSLPHMDGCETARKIRRQSPGGAPLLIALVSPQGRDSLMQQMREQPEMFDAVLMKPITPSMLFDALVNVTSGAPAAASVPAPANVHCRRLVGLQVLLVEDNPTNQQVAAELLQYEGARVDVAGNGQEGVAMVAAHPGYDAVLMDIQMPVMDGNEATRVLRGAGHTGLCIIAMTANVLETDRRRSLEAGVDDFIGKPINIDAMIDTLLRHCPGKVLTDTTEPPLSALATKPPIVAPAGMELVNTIARFGHNHSLYVRMARAYRTEQEQTPARLRQALEARDTAEAAQLLHALKGSAATLGAQRLAQASSRMEMLILNPMAAADRAQELDALEVCLHEAFTGLDALAAQLDEGTPQAAAQPAHSVQPATAPVALLAGLAGVELLLAASNLEALTQFSQLQQYAGEALRTEMAALDAALDQLDFAQARTLCRQLRAALLAERASAI
jgi:PAS domain S-box-containing protein